MNLAKHIDKIVFTLILLNYISCDSTLPNTNKEEPNLISKLLKVINSSNVDRYVLSKDGLKKVNSKYNKKIGLEDLFNNRMLAKRVVPHRYDGSNYEYDRKSNAVYKPRVQGNPKLIFKANERNSIIKAVNGLPKNVRNAIYNDEVLLQPFHTQQRNKVTFQSILKDVETYLAQVHSVSDVRMLKFAILALLEKYPRDILRHKFTSKEDLEELLFRELGRPSDKKKKKWVPDYPYWNYWTYDKTIHQDVCKGKLVHLGLLCVETPPH